MDFSFVKPGVLSGSEAAKVLDYCKEKGFALPAINVVGTNSVNAVMEAAKEVNLPIIIQFSNGGAHFWAGKGLDNDGQKAAVLGAIAGAKTYPYTCRSVRSACNSAYRPRGKETSSVD